MQPTGGAVWTSLGGLHAPAPTLCTSKDCTEVTKVGMIKYIVLKKENTVRRGRAMSTNLQPAEIKTG